MIRLLQTASLNRKISRKGTKKQKKKIFSFSKALINMRGKLFLEASF